MRILEILDRLPSLLEVYLWVFYILQVVKAPSTHSVHVGLRSDYSSMSFAVLCSFQLRRRWYFMLSYTSGNIPACVNLFEAPGCGCSSLENVVTVGFLCCFHYSTRIMRVYDSPSSKEECIADVDMW